MSAACKKHKLEIHDWIEKIITFKHNTSKVPCEDQKRITLTCAQVDNILLRTALVKYHSEDHAPEWEPVVERHIYDLACGTCGNFYRDKVIEEARKLGIV